MDGQNLCPANRGESHSSNPAALYVSLELSSAKWLITLLAPGSEKMSRHIVSGGSGDALLDLLDRLKEKCERSIGSPMRIVAIMEAGRDGFWIHRLLEANQVESHVVEERSRNRKPQRPFQRRAVRRPETCDRIAIHKLQAKANPQDGPSTTAADKPSLVAVRNAG